MNEGQQAGLLKDKITLITGAGRGLGQSVALAYARQGAQVIAVARTRSELDTTAEMIEAEGGRVLTMSVDLAQEEQMRQMTKRTLSEFSRLDVLVNNAARLPLKSFEDMTMAEWDDTMTINLRSPVLLCKLFLGSMKAQGRGSIINVSSNAGVKGFELETDYCTSKFGLEGFSRALALEVKKDNIAVNTITPGGLTGYVRIKPTSMTQADFDDLSEEEQAKWHDAIVLTEAFVYLALQDANGVTGERVYAYDLSEQIRREGWDIIYQSAITE
jgi:NAD(P)-dependent dehydrogenase (short-subunit alcohol dehydrogenase family)